MKYVIVGNGIVALTAAFRFHQRLGDGDQVVVIGPRDRPGCASLCAGAMLNSFGEIGAYSLRSDYDLFHFELSHAATRMWPTFEEELIRAAGDHLPAACRTCEILGGGGCYDRGTFIINNCAADDLDDRNFDAIVKALVDFDEPHELVDPREIPNYFPSQRLRATRAVYIHDEGWLNPYIVIEKLDAILNHSVVVTVVDGTADRFIKGQGGIAAVELADGQVIEGDRFLLATGATVGRLLAKSDLGLDVQPVFYGAGHSIEIKSPGHPHVKTVRTPNRGGACGTYTVPYFKGPDEVNDHVLIGASNRLQPEPGYQERIGSISHLLQSAIEEINGHFSSALLMRINYGWRPTTQDAYPLLGSTSIKNFFIASGTKRDGFHLSPLLSNYLADVMTGQDVDRRFEWFAPERRLIRDLSREDAVEMAVAGLMSEQYQHGYTPSGVLMNQQVRETYRRDIEELHDRVGAKDWGIPPLLINMYRLGYAR